MGLKYNGNPNKRDGMKWGSGDTSCPLSLLTSLMRRRETFDRDTLHPEAIALVTSIVAGETGTLDFTAPGGQRLEVRIDPSEKRGDDLEAGLKLIMNGVDAFDGRMTLARFHARGFVTMAHCLIGTIEIFYDHLLEQVVLDRAEDAEMRIGIARVEGRVLAPAIVRDALGGTIVRNGREYYPGFDHEVVYGLFPDEGFHHFYGDHVKLKEGLAG